MCDNFCVRLLIFGLPCLVFGLIGMLCFTAGFVANTNFNNGLSRATCITKSTQVKANTCSYKCNCDGDGNCQTCHYTCYDGYVTAAIQSITLGTQFQVINSLKTSFDVSNYLDTNYPINSEFTCYYNSNVNTTGRLEIYLGPKDAQSSYIAGLVFCGFAATVLLVWIIVEIIICIPSCMDSVSDCCNNIRRNGQMKKAERNRVKEQKMANKLREEELTRSKEESYKPTKEDYEAPPAINDLDQPAPSAPPLRNSSKVALY